jgi:hypothetical protein
MVSSRAELNQALLHSLPDVGQDAGLTRGVVAVNVAVDCAAIQLGGLGNHVLHCLSLPTRNARFFGVMLRPPGWQARGAAQPL